MPTARRFDKAFRMCCCATALVSVSLVSVTGVLAAGCAKKPPEPADMTSATSSVQTTAQSPPASAGSAAPATAASSPAPAPGASGGPTTTMAPNDQSLAAEIAFEAQNRKPGNPSVEQVFALCEKLGAQVPTKTQSIGKTYRASYCVGGFTTDKTVTINVCEYPSEAAATQGVTVSTSKFPTLVDRRQVIAHKGTTLTLFEAEPSAKTKALVKKLGDAFLAM